MPEIPFKFETASKCAYFVMVLGAFASVIIAASWAHGQWGGVAMAMVLAAGVVGAGFLSSFGAEGLAAYWRRRHDAEMLKEVDRLKAEAGRHAIAMSIGASESYDSGPRRREGRS